MRTSLISAGSLVGGYAAGKATGQRPLAGVVTAAGAAVCARQWLRRTGPGTTAALLAVMVGGLGASHPLARKVGAWPSVLGVGALTGLAAHLLADRRR